MGGVGTAIRAPRKGTSGEEEAPEREDTGISRALCLAVQGPSCVCVCVSVSIAGGHRAVFPVGPWKLQRMQPYSSPGMSQGLAQGHAAHGGLAGRTGLRPPAQRFLPRRYSGAKGQMCLPGFRGTRGRASQCAITNRLEPHRWNPVMGRWAAGRIL